MKKIIVVVLVLLLAFSMIACGNKQEANEIAGLYDEGFTPSMWSMSEDTWVGIFQKEMAYDQVYVVTLKVTDKENEKISDANLADDSDKVIKNIISYIPGPVVEDITSEIPGEDELNNFVGMTLGEVEEMGYSNVGNLDTDDKHIYSYDGPIYTVDLELDTADIADWNDVSPNELMTLKVKAAEFAGFSSMFIEGKF